MNRSKAMIAILLLVILSATLSAGRTHATVPTRISYQGFLEDQGQPVSGTRSLHFVLYRTPIYQDSIWSESHASVIVDRGVFRVELGSIRPLTAAIVDWAALYLETRVDGTPLSPRKRLDSVPYALVSVRADSAAYAESAAHAVTATTAVFAEHAAAADSAVFAEHAAYADSAGAGGGGGSDPSWGTGASSSIYNLNTGNVGIGTATPTFGKLQVQALSGVGLHVSASSDYGVKAWTYAPSGGVGVWGGADGQTGTPSGVMGYANGPAGRGVYGQADHNAGSTIGVLGEASSAAGYGVAGKNLATSGAGVGVHGATVGSTGSGVYGTNSSTGNTGAGVLGVNSSSTGTGIRGNNLAASGWGIGAMGTSVSTTGAGLYGSSTGATGYGVYGANSGGTGYGVYGNSTGATGTGVYGNSSGTSGFGVKGSGATTGVQGTATGAGGSGVYGSAASGVGVYGSGFTGGYFTTTANHYLAHAISAESSSEDAAAVNIVASGAAATALYAEASSDGTVYGYGGHFVCRSDNGKAVYGEATSTTGTGNYNYGGKFSSSGGSGAGVLGYGDSSTSDTPGIIGQHITTDNLGYGVVGYGNHRGLAGYAYGSNTAGTYHYGVYGSATGGTAGTNYGVYGYANGGTTRYAGYFSGNVHVTGTLSKAAGSFKIDHPLDPANKYLQHSFVESPDMMNVYNGNTILDGSGEAVVSLPDYFEALNRDFRYQLTCVGGFAPVYIAAKVSGGQFRIAGGTPGLEVSWQVTGIRQDAYARAHPIPVETDKPLTERGTYMHAVERGMPETMQTDRVLAGGPEPGPVVLPEVKKNEK